MMSLVDDGKSIQSLKGVASDGPYRLELSDPSDDTDDETDVGFTSCIDELL